jgi:hypothetical protein
MQIRNRVKKVQTFKPAQLAAHPLNWKVHGLQQRQAFRALLNEVGFAGVGIVYKSKRNKGRLTLIDAHMRQEEVGPDFEMPCIVTDLTDEEADKLLALGDRVAALSEVDPGKVEALLKEIATESDELDCLLASLAEEAGLKDAGEVELKKLSVQRPPAMSWILIGIPTVRFAEVAAIAETVASIPDTIVETTVSDKPKE